MGGEGSGQTEEERRFAADRKQVAEKRIEDYRSLLDSAFEMLGQIMPYDKIAEMPYKLLIYELERRRQFLEKNKQYAENKEMEKQMKVMGGVSNKSQGRQR